MNLRYFALSFATTVLFCSCGDDGETSKKFRSTPPNKDYSKRKDVYPFEHTMTDSQGRAIEVVVVGRTKNSVIFQKGDSEQRYNHPLHSLSASDRSFISSLPLREWQGGNSFSTSLSDEQRRNTERIADLEAKIESTPGAPTRNRGYQREIARLKAVNQRLAQQVRERQKAKSP
jgi:hypothetical protein